jgi:hypothetical protein
MAIELTSLDAIVRSLLFKEGRGLHYYIEYLKYVADSYKELTETTIGLTKTVEVPVTSYGAVLFPVDCKDLVQVGFKAGERIRNLINDEGLNPMYNYDSNNNKIPYPAEDSNWDGCVSSYTNQSDEQPDYGARTDRGDYFYKVIVPRGEIQLSANYPYKTVVLKYIPDKGATGNPACEVEILATDTIEKHTRWQRKIHKDAPLGEQTGAENIYVKAFKMLRAKKSGLTKEEIIHAVRSGFSPLPKQ